MVTLQQTLTLLSNLAREQEADYQSTIQLELFGGATVAVYWTGCADDALPRETHLFFGPDSDGGFKWAFCYDPSKYMAAIEEGLSGAEAEDASRTMVEDIDDVIAYLQGLSYRSTTRTGVAAKVAAFNRGIENMLDKDREGV